MSTTEQVKSARTIEEILQVLNLVDYLPLFEKANIVHGSAFTLLREADLKAEDELSRCQLELNSKRNELARLQKHDKISREVYEMTVNARQQVIRLYKRCTKCRLSSLQQMASDVERLLGATTVPVTPSSPAKENLPPSPVPRNTTQYGSLPRYHLDPGLLQEYHSRPYYIQRPKKSSGPWYTKAIAAAPQPVRTRPAAATDGIQRPLGIDRRNSEKNQAISKAATSSENSTSFMEGLFSKFGKNRTSTPIKPPATA